MRKLYQIILFYFIFRAKYNCIKFSILFLKRYRSFFSQNLTFFIGIKNWSKMHRVMFSIVYNLFLHHDDLYRKEEIDCLKALT